MRTRFSGNLRWVGLVAVAAIVAGTIAALPLTAADKEKPALSAKGKASPDLKRAQREVKLLDDIYKSAIVLITEHYVEDDSSLAAGEAFKALFAMVKEKGWHEVRLIDAAGEPINDANEPQDDFERDAIKALKSGDAYYEVVGEQDGKRYLRAATPIPIVLEKCKMCHDNYKDQKVIGALGYKLPLTD